MVTAVLVVVLVSGGAGFLLGMLAADVALRRRERRLHRDLARLRAPRTPRADPGS